MFRIMDRVSGWIRSIAQKLMSDSQYKHGGQQIYRHFYAILCIASIATVLASHCKRNEVHNERSIIEMAEELYPEVQVGTVLFYDSGYSMMLPHFLRVENRTACYASVVELKTKNMPSDPPYNQCGSRVPLVDEPATGILETKVQLNAKSGYMKFDGHYTSVWDGKPKQYDYMD